MPVGEVGVEEVDQVRVLHVPHDLDLSEEQRQSRLLAQIDILHSDPAAGGLLCGHANHARGPESRPGRTSYSNNHLKEYAEQYVYAAKYVCHVVLRNPTRG